MDPLANEVGTAGSTDIELMKKELNEYGFKEENLCKEEMSDLLKALRFSKSSATEEENGRSKTDLVINNASAAPTESLHRRYKNVTERRLPWCLLPPNLTTAQRVQCLSAYIKILSINQYIRARELSKFEAWPAPRNIPSQHSSRSICTRSTRSGRSAPSYALIDDEDSNELDEFVPRKSKKRKVSSSETSNSDVCIYVNKTFSLKRKPQRVECPKPEKESKVNENSSVFMLNADSSTKGDLEDVTEPSAASIVYLIDSICNSNNDVSTSKDQQRPTKTRQKKT